MLPNGLRVVRAYAARTVQGRNDEVHSNRFAGLPGGLVAPLLELLGDEGHARLRAWSDRTKGVSTSNSPVGLNNGAENEGPVGALALELGRNAKVDAADFEWLGDVAADAEDWPDGRSGCGRGRGGCGNGRGWIRRE